VHALVACYGGRIGYKEACFSLDLFIISSSSFASLCLSYLILHFRLITFRLSIPLISLCLNRILLYLLCYIQSTCVNPYLNFESAVPEPCC